jgi:hypothetical protein
MMITGEQPAYIPFVRVDSQLTIDWTVLCRANKEIDVDPLASPAAADDVPVPKGKGKQAKSAYALLEEFEAGGGEDNEDGAGGGGLMVSKSPYLFQVVCFVH